MIRKFAALKYVALKYIVSIPGARSHGNAIRMACSQRIVARLRITIIQSFPIRSIVT